jgi:hypothetical protein
VEAGEKRMNEEKPKTVKVEEDGTITVPILRGTSSDVVVNLGKARAIRVEIGRYCSVLTFFGKDYHTHQMIQFAVFFKDETVMCEALKAIVKQIESGDERVRVG